MPEVIGYDDFQRDLQRRKRDRWAKILAAEPPGRAPGRRPRDPEQERLLLRLDRLRLERRDRALTDALEKRHRRGYERHPVRPDEFSGWEQEQAWPD